LKATFLISLVIVLALSGCIEKQIMEYIQVTPQSTPIKYVNETSQPPKYIKYVKATPQQTSIPKNYSNLLIDNISQDLEAFHIRGWGSLYVRGEFDCSRMSTYMWSYIRDKYKVPPKIVLAPSIQHAWVAVRVMDTGSTDRYPHWTIHGVDYYFIETTSPEVVAHDGNCYLGGKLYEPCTNAYNVNIYLADTPLDANDLTGEWGTDFRLTKPDLDKLNSFKS
jgi:hypothetical protein